MKKREKKCFLQRVFAVIFAVTILCSISGCNAVKHRETKETEDTTFGIDVARYQGTIDWAQVAQSSVDFAMVRIGYRGMSDGEIKEDTNAKYNLQEAGRAGIPLGAYFFSTAVSVEEAMEEAAWAADFVAQYSITYPIVYDCEGYGDPQSRQYGLTKTERTDIALAFLETIEKLGYEGMFYASRNEMQDEAAWEVSRIEGDYKIWVAQYPEIPYPGTVASSYTGAHHMWQYSMEGTVPGITQAVDLNVAYFGYDGIEPPKDDTPPAEAVPDASALMSFDEISEQVTAKEETRLRNMPSQDEESSVLFILKNGEVAQRIAVSDSGWSKLIYENVVCYAVSSYLTTDLNYDPEESAAEEKDEDEIKTQFTPVNELVTAKEVVNLRKLPSVEHEDADVLAELHNGDIATRIGISDNGWSKLVYNGMTCYGISSYMTTVGIDFIEQQADDADIGMEFEAVVEQVVTTKAVNLRTLPSTERTDSEVVVKMEEGETLTRTGVNKELEWSRVVYQGQTLYCVSWYLTEMD